MLDKMNNSVLSLRLNVSRLLAVPSVRTELIPESGSSNR